MEGGAVAKMLKQLPALLIGFLLGGAVMFGLFLVAINQPPPTPKLRPPTSIKVTLYPWEGMGPIDSEPVEIPPDKLDLTFRLITPESYYRYGILDSLMPAIGHAVVTHADGKETFVLIRDFGHNPALVTVNGRHYFVARNDPDVHAGATQIFGLVQIARQKKAAP